MILSYPRSSISRVIEGDRDTTLWIADEGSAPGITGEQRLSRNDNDIIADIKNFITGPIA
ncbi:MAG: hypothetical protein A2W19_03425 [Spirochaetes bacterium RBG_16_49_21]|nr:MAG: hypothetical protein A2W19_03425 [Spirochaetes bacterium RBG_16_49_21]